MDIKQRAANLELVYGRLSNTSVANRAKHELAFFNLFPSSFIELELIYGFPGEQPSILYDRAHEHIVLFGSLKTINDTLYYERLVNVSINAWWDADGINDFQRIVIERAIRNPGLLIFVLKTHPRNDIESFWKFYVDGPHHAGNLDKGIYAIREIDKELYAMLIAARDKAIKEDDHGH